MLNVISKIHFRDSHISQYIRDDLRGLSAEWSVFLNKAHLHLIGTSHKGVFFGNLKSRIGVVRFKISNVTFFFRF